MKTRFKCGLQNSLRLTIFIGLISKTWGELSNYCEKAKDYDKDAFVEKGGKCIRDPPINFDHVNFDSPCVSLCMDSGGDPQETWDQKTLGFKSFFEHDTDKALAASDKACSFDAFLPFTSALSKTTAPDPSRNTLSGPCDSDPKFLSCMDNTEEWVEALEGMWKHINEKSKDTTISEVEKVDMVDIIVSEIQDYPFKKKLTPAQLKGLQDGINTLVDQLKNNGVGGDLLSTLDTDLGLPTTPAPPSDVDSALPDSSSGSDGSNLDKFQDMVDSIKDKFPDADPNLVSNQVETTPIPLDLDGGEADVVAEEGGGGGGVGTHPQAEGAQALAQLRSLIDDIDDEIQKGKKPSKKHIRSLHRLVKKMRDKGLKIPKVMRKDLKLVLDHIRHHHSSDEDKSSKKKKKHKKKKSKKGGRGRNHNYHPPRYPLHPLDGRSGGGAGGGSGGGGGSHPYEQKMLVEVKNPDQLKDFKVTFKGLDKGQSDSHDDEHAHEHEMRQKEEKDPSDYSDYLEYLDYLDY